MSANIKKPWILWKKAAKSTHALRGHDEGFGVFEFICDGEGRLIDALVIEVNRLLKRCWRQAQPVISRLITEIFPNVTADDLNVFLGG